jgi:hypothetical protein
VRAHFLWRVPYLERAQGVLDGARRGSCGTPRGPLEVAAPAHTVRDCTEDHVLPVQPAPRAPLKANRQNIHRAGISLSRCVCGPVQMTQMASGSSRSAD